MSQRLKIGDQEFYTIEEAAEVLHPLYTVKTLRRKAYADEVPRHGGRGRGKVCFSNDDLIKIREMSQSKTREVAPEPTPEPVPAEVVELPSALRFTSRSRALHRGKAA